MDKSLAIEWPHPINGDKFVMSEKDLSAAPPDEKLWATIKARIDDPITDMHTVTNSDIVVVSSDASEGLPIVKQLQGTRVHLLQQNARNRESLRAALVSLRPKDGVIYVVNQRKGTSGELLTEMLNVLHVCDELKHQLVILTEAATKEVDIVAELAAKERPGAVTVLVGQCVLYSGMEKKEMAERLAAADFTIPSFTNLDDLAKEAIRALTTKTAGKFVFVNPGKLDAAAVKSFCAANGANFKATINANPVPENDFNKVTNAQDSFANLTH